MSGPLQRSLRIARTLGPLLAGLALVAVLATPVLAPSSASTTNEGSDGLSQFAAIARDVGYEVRVSAVNPTQATAWSPASTTIVVGDSPALFLGPTADALEDWRSEGRLLVADGRGGSLPLAEALGVPVTPRRILDASLSSDPTAVPTELRTGEDPHSIQLRQPFAVDRERLDRDRWTPLAETRDSSFVDLNGNERLDQADTRGPFLVGVRADPGTALLTSGALLENRALADEEGRAAVRDLLTTVAPEGGTIVFDASHADHGLAGDGLLALLRPAVSILSSPLWGVLALLAMVGGTASLLVQRAESVTEWSSGGPSPGEVTREGGPLDLDFMSEALDSVLEDAAGDGAPDRHRALSERLRRAGADTGSPEE